MEWLDFWGGWSFAMASSHVVRFQVLDVREEPVSAYYFNMERPVYSVRVLDVFRDAFAASCESCAHALETGDVIDIADFDDVSFPEGDDLILFLNFFPHGRSTSCF